jgi:hypothetical protein
MERNNWQLKGSTAGTGVETSSGRSLSELHMLRCGHVGEPALGWRGGVEGRRPRGSGFLVAWPTLCTALLLAGGDQNLNRKIAEQLRAFI